MEFRESLVEKPSAAVATEGHGGSVERHKSAGERPPSNQKPADPSAQTQLLWSQRAVNVGGVLWDGSAMS